MEIEGTIGNIIEVDGHPYERFLCVHYGFMGLRYIVLWTDKYSDQYPYAIDAYNKEYKVGMRYDRQTKELLAIWEGK